MEISERSQVLNFLYAVCSDRLEQYRNAQEEIRDSHLKECFGHFENSSAQMMQEIQDLLRDLHLEWQEESTLSGDLHNLWIDFRSKLSGHDTEAILKAMACAEEANLKKYKQEWETNQGGDDSIQTLIQQHIDRITDSMNYLNEWKENHTEVKK